MIQQAVHLVQAIQQIEDEVQRAHDQTVDQAGDHIQQRPQRLKQYRHYSTSNNRQNTSRRPAHV